MAGGNLSPRQKMINLMYLVFISMLALNMSKEVLASFGLMNERFEESNTASTKRNTNFIDLLAGKAADQPEKYEPLKKKADAIDVIATDLYNFIEDIKTEITATAPKDEAGNFMYASMDKSEQLDAIFFPAEGIEPKRANEFIAKVDKFKTEVPKILKDEKDIFKDLFATIERKFDVHTPIKGKDGVKKEWLEYQFSHIPLIASLSKLSALQADVKSTESEILNTLFSGQLQAESAATADNLEAIVLADKGAFFSSDKFTGKIILGKKDKTLVPTKVVINGKTLSKSAIKNGATMLDFPAGNVGERDIEGTITFMSNGKEEKIPVKSSYSVIPMPNSATISADKMNVVYRGVVNPMTISFAGVQSNKVKATAPGLKSIGKGRYTMSPGTGKSVTINVTGTLPNGKPVSDRATFRIKDIPKPTGMLSKKDGVIKLPRRNVEIGTVSAELVDFDFDLPIEVKEFSFKVPGQATVKVKGNRLSASGKAALKRARRGDAVQIFDIKAQIKGNARYNLKKVSPVIVELTN